MDKQYRNFPRSVIIIRLLIVFTLLLSAFYLVYLSHIFLFTGYMGYVTVSLVLFLKYGCSRCLYYGKWCDLGIGKMVPLIFRKKHDLEHFTCFTKKSYGWLLVFFAIPLLAGFISLITTGGLLLIILYILYITSVLAFFYTSSTLSCPHCKMNTICHPGMIITGKN